MSCAQILWRGTQSAGLGNRKKLRQRYSISARRELHSSPELHYRWTAVFLRKPGSFERAYDFFRLVRSGEHISAVPRIWGQPADFLNNSQEKWGWFSPAPRRNGRSAAKSNNSLT